MPSPAAPKKPREVNIYEAFRGKTDADRQRALDYIAKGGCLTECDENNMTLLHHAVFGGNVDIVKALVNVVNGDGAEGCSQPAQPPLSTLSEQRLDLDAGDADGWTALHYAADRGHAAVVGLLVEDAGANVNARDYSKRTPLHLAALGGHEDVVKTLLAGGAMKRAKNAAGMSPADCAKAAGHDGVAALLA